MPRLLIPILSSVLLLLVSAPAPARSQTKGRQAPPAQLSTEINSTSVGKTPSPPCRVEHSRREIKGWTLHINESLLKEKPAVVARALEILSLQLDRVANAVPPTTLKQLRTVPLWLNPPYPDTRPKAEYHPNPIWLRDNRRDPAMAKSIEFTNASIMPFENRRMPWFVLHELAHAYHDQVLAFNHPKIIAAYNLARDGGNYDSVKRWTGKTDTVEKAYAMNNHKEYFAENTEAFFGKNDFFPFTRKDLKKHDPLMHNLLDKLWK